MKPPFGSTSAAYIVSSSMEPTLINTPLQRGEIAADCTLNRFSGLRHPGKTAEAVQRPDTPRSTPLKRGVNEISVAVKPASL
jgi:hypothetical protein